MIVDSSWNIDVRCYIETCNQCLKEKLYLSCCTNTVFKAFFLVCFHFLMNTLKRAFYLLLNILRLLQRRESS